MKILTQLAAEKNDGDWLESRGVIQAVHDEPTRGFFRQITLGAAGVVVKRGDVAVGIPIGEILKLAETHEPALVPPVPANE